jgi:hypothetical protein
VLAIRLEEAKWRGADSVAGEKPRDCSRGLKVWKGQGDGGEEVGDRRPEVSW